MKYIKLFETHSGYTEFIGGGGDTPFVKPNVSHCIEENEVHYNPRTWADEYLTFVALEDSTFKLSGNSVSYSLDNGETWTELASDTNSPTVTSGNKIIWKGTLTPTTNKGIGTFSSTGRFDVKGNVMSLLYGDNFMNQTDLTSKNYAFYRLFYDNTNIVNADKLVLPATTLANNCYESMFGECTSLTTSPELPATTLANSCYGGMFSYCTSLTTAPELPATTSTYNCYSSMFFRCTNLTTAPQLPTTTLAEGCYNQMFYGCTSLTTAPELPATELAVNCYFCMFGGCTNLTTAPELPATTLTRSCYHRMFDRCTSLTTAPELPATTLAESCYQQMFQNCTSLNSITCLATDISASSCTGYWVENVSSTGIFKKAENMTSWTNGVNGIPNGWTVQDAS